MTHFRPLTVSAALAIVISTGGHDSSNATETIGKEVKEVHAVVVNAATELNLSDSEWTDLPTAATTIKVPSSTKALIVARWTGVSNPTSSTNSGLQIRILVGGDQMQP